MSGPIPSEIIQSLVVPNCGALFLAAILSCVFYGLTLLQTYSYYDGYWNDKASLKIFVLLLAILDTAHVISTVAGAWWYLIPNYGNLASLETVKPALAVAVGMTYSIGLLVQCFFASHVWRMGRTIVIPVIIVTSALTAFGFGVAYTAVGQRTKLESTIPTIGWISDTAIATSMASDIISTMSLAYYLHRRRTGMKRSRTNRIINALITYAVNTGLITSIAATATIILTKVSSGTYWNAVPYFLVSKCYVNSVLATLNAREKLRNLPMGLSTLARSVELGEIRIAQSSTVLHDHNDTITVGTSGSLGKISLTETKLQEDALALHASHSSV